MNINMNWKSEKLLEWVDRSRPEWSDFVIKNWTGIFLSSGIDVTDFVLEKHCNRGDINMEKVVGQWEHYAGQTWLAALLEPKYKPWKMKNTIDLFDDNADYYFNGNKKDIYFTSLDGNEWYCNSGGNHRTIIAKFALSMAKDITGTHFDLKNVHTTRYIVDWNLFYLFRDFLDLIKRENLHISVIVEKKHINSSYREEYSIENYSIHFFLSDYRYRSKGVFARLSVSDFQKYAVSIIKERGKINKLKRAHYWWNFLFNRNELIF